MVRGRFVDDPHAAVAEARELVTLVMSDRGYPTDDVDDQQIADELSVEHGRTVSEYRTAAAISARAADGEASTEDLRTAMVHYRALFAELLDSTAEDLSAVSSGHPYQSESTADRSSTGGSCPTRRPLTISKPARISRTRGRPSRGSPTKTQPTTRLMNGLQRNGSLMNALPRNGLRTTCLAGRDGRQIDL